jgi:hypothetical protein
MWLLGSSEASDPLQGTMISVSGFPFDVRTFFPTELMSL